MISSIRIQGYRCFDRFEMGNLGRLNLLVGTNNSGKTSVLEALYLLTSRGDPLVLRQLLMRRGERFVGDRNQRNINLEFDISHLFTGHHAHPGSGFTLAAENQTPELFLRFLIVERPLEGTKEFIEPDEAVSQTMRPVLQIEGHPRPITAALPLTRVGCIAAETLDQFRRVRGRVSEGAPAQFITAESLDSDDLGSLWDRVALTPSESLVLRALNFLDPDIERIAAQSNPRYYGQRGGFIIKRKGFEQPIPIGSMGDGMWRMMAMAIAITQARGGVLLVDEIDTGLHYTVMSDMWRLIFGAALELDVQVFATTHSYDCIQSLASVCVSQDNAGSIVTLQRIEPGKPRAIPYSESEIRVAAKENIEVR
ncbi:MAG: AAA family ATPase [Blastocatellia bacterium]